MGRPDGISTVAVLGAGTMGHGIAEEAAIGGYDVVLRDVEEALVEEGYADIEWSVGKLAEKGLIEESTETVMARVSTAVDIADAVADADLVIEAVPEDLDIKRSVFADVEAHVGPDTILASNTSSLSITAIAEATDSPERVVGTHFFNPPVKMNLVEVIYGDETADGPVEAATAFVESIDKTPIVVRKDVPEFVVNRVLRPYIWAPAWIVSSGEATMREVDAAMVYRRGYLMGPFALADMIGLDVMYHIGEEAGEPIPPILAERFEADDLGVKSDAGFFDYDGGGLPIEPEDGADFDPMLVEAPMVNRAAELLANDVTTPEEVDLGIRLGANFPEGVCRRADRNGLEAVVAALEHLQEVLGMDRYVPEAYLRTMVDDGRTGADAGVGFYDYAGDGPDPQFVDHRLEDGVLTVELARPERNNALSTVMLEELTDVVKSTAGEDDVRCLVVEGRGDAFCTGADVGAFTTAEPADVESMLAPFGAATEALAAYPDPTIARIHGNCLGGGLELALACDFRIAAESAQFGLPETDLGLIPGAGGTQRLPRLVGPGRARELVLLSRTADGERAADYGLVTRAVPTADLDEAVSAVVEDVLAGAPLALRVAKQVLDEGADASLESALAVERKGVGVLLGTRDAREGLLSAFQGRDPAFEGR